MKKVLGLDLGTNSIGWSLVEHDFNNQSGKILGIGTRIIPMSQDVLGKFDSGVSVSQTAERTNFRGIRRLRERHLLRRERLHRVLHILGFLPQHYRSQIDFENKLGQFKEETEPKLAYHIHPETGKPTFYFTTAFAEMLEDFKQYQPELLNRKNRNGADAKVPYDWTIYYLRQKALREKIEREELAWLLLQFNQKRGYYQLRGEEEEEETPNKKVEFFALKVVSVEATEDKKGADTWYNVHLENGWIYRRTSRVPLDWAEKTKEFIVTTELNDDGSEKLDKEGKVRRSFRAPAENDWTLVKKKTEHDIIKSRKFVGEYIYENLLASPNQKIKGKLVRVIERNFYKEELKAILETQQAFHPELQNPSLYQACLQELYKHNEAHKESITGKGFVHLFLNDIIFYQRPLRSKKSLISNCKFEVRCFVKEGKTEVVPLKGIAKSHPLFKEFRLWQFLQNLRLFKRETGNDQDITEQYLSTEEQKVKLFEWLNTKKEIKQEALLKQVLGLKKVDDYRWNYIDSKDKTYPGNETHAEIVTRLNKIGIAADFLTAEKEEALWHILYSVEDKADIAKVLKAFADRNNLSEDFVEQFRKFPKLEKEYGSYSAKALKKLLPLMRIGKYWTEQSIIENTPQYQQNIQKVITTSKEKETKLTDEQRSGGKSANQKLLDKLGKLQDNPEDYQGLEHHIASYVVYGRHSEDSDMLQWRTPADIEYYLKEVFKQHALRNPIVEGVIRETLQVVKDIWKHYGNSQPEFFDEIHVELGREMKNPAEVRKEMTARMNDNENTNLRIKALLAELLHDKEVEGVRPYSPMQQEILKIYEEGVLAASGSNLPDDIVKISRLPQPTSSELKRYKLWLEQGYRSPYTGNVIPLNRLFTRSYDIEHIIPQSRFFDDSLSNKVICETEVNADKGNCTAYEYMKQKGGSKVTDTNISLLSLPGFEELVKRDFSKSKTKARKLLMEDIPEEFVERQMNDTRYISKVVKDLLSNIVREDGEQEAISKKVVPVTGAVTSQMKQDWGLEHVWNELVTPRFKRLNELTGTNDYGEVNPNTNKFLPKVPLLNSKNFSKKRIDHRHHALDALVIACITKDHTNYLHSLNSQRNNMSMVSKLRRIEKYKVNGTERNVAKEFKKPWENFTQDAKVALEQIVVSFKQNTRVLTTTNNQYQKWVQEEDGSWNKKTVAQEKGESKAIRKPMHKDTVSGLVKLKFRKTVSFSAALDTWEMITDKSLRKQVAVLTKQGFDKKKLIKFFKDNENKWDDKDISRIEVFYWDIDKEGVPNNAANRVLLDETFNSLMINVVTDTGIQKILFSHLFKYNEEKNGKIIEHPELAFSPDGIDAMNKNLRELNDGKPHQPIYKVRTYEPRGNKFAVGETGNKKHKYVEAAKGTNLFFAIYQNGTGKRTYDTIPLNVVIERKKQSLSPVPEKNEVGDNLLMYLSPNDLVYVPDEHERQNRSSINFNKLTKEQVNRVYKMEKASGKECYFIQSNVANLIIQYSASLKIGEFGSQNKLQSALDGTKIVEFCIKLKIDRLGNVKSA